MVDELRFLKFCKMWIWNEIWWGCVGFVWMLVSLSGVVGFKFIFGWIVKLGCVFLFFYFNV